MRSHRPTHQRLSRLANAAEWLLWMLGVSCVCFVIVSWGIRLAAAQTAVTQFIQLQENRAAYAGATDANPEAHASWTGPDQRLWSDQRIAAYAQSNAKLDARAVRALLRIPRLGLEAPLYEGTDNWVLNRGLGRIPGTAPIGAPGNLAVAGHRDSYFRVLKDISKHDQIEIVTAGATTRYEVTDTWIVQPDEVHVLEPTGKQVITLVTCYPFYYVGSAPQRFIVRAAAVEPR